jgi:hypothetical protein
MVFLQDFHPVNQSVATKLKAERRGEKVSFSRRVFLLKRQFPGRYQG